MSLSRSQLIYQVYRIINVVVCHLRVLKSIITNQGLLFISKFRFLLCYFLRIKKKVSAVFHIQTNGQTKRQNNTIESYFKVFVNQEQNNETRPLQLAEFVYNNVKNASTGQILFKLNYRFHPCDLFTEDADSHSRSHLADKLLNKLRELIEIFCQNVLYVQKLQQKTHNKGVKSHCYAPDEKV